ncbi:lactate/malate family dehydrogenase [Streptomyces melanogenes]|uniref:lactate/malate family dehydrogenase n=1 Tax=Streptomyces melanogenes TaxID=67326 RepID=UPI00167E31BB|nr:NAD(P)-binding domain-containing protein [Streptomyces melanogenes]GGP80086.1 L-lactate dehydrogenase [Streptomyces melanogenes]
MTGVGIVGAGAVGQTIGALLVTTGWCTQITVTSRTEESAVGLACDLEDMAAVTGSHVRVQPTADAADLAACEALVVCPRARFTNTATNDVRMAGLAANAPVITALGRELEGYTGVVIVVTNPVDIMTRLFAEASGAVRVFGIGSHTDTARYRIALANRLGLPLGSVQARVIGEHGEDAVITGTTVNGRPLTAVPPGIRREAARRPTVINAGIGRTRCGPAGAVLAALRHTLGLVDGVLELSAHHEGAWLGVPVRLTAGHPTIALPRLSPDEQAALTAARTKLTTAYEAIPSIRKETVV